MMALAFADDADGPSSECMHCFEVAVQDTELCEKHLEQDIWQQADEAYDRVREAGF